LFILTDLLNLCITQSFFQFLFYMKINCSADELLNVLAHKYKWIPLQHIHCFRVKNELLQLKFYKQNCQTEARLPVSFTLFCVWCLILCAGKQKLKPHSCFYKTILTGLSIFKATVLCLISVTKLRVFCVTSLYSRYKLQGLLVITKNSPPLTKINTRFLKIIVKCYGEIWKLSLLSWNKNVSSLVWRLAFMTDICVVIAIPLMDDIFCPVILTTLQNTLTYEDGDLWNLLGIDVCNLRSWSINGLT
jgi:hypothetical protein